MTELLTSRTSHEGHWRWRRIRSLSPPRRCSWRDRSVPSRCNSAISRRSSKSRWKNSPRSFLLPSIRSLPSEKADPEVDVAIESAAL